MEAALIHSSTELREMRELATGAFTLRDRTQAEWMAMHQHMVALREDRDAVLQATRAEVERRKDDLQQKEQRIRVLNV